MDHTTLIVIFLAIMVFHAFIYTVVMIFSYKGLAKVTVKVDDMVREFERSASIREWIASLEKAAAQSVVATEMAKQKLAECEPVLEDIQVRYGFMLAKVDTNVERFTDAASETAMRVRDAVANPAQRMDVVTAALHKAVDFISSADATPRP